MDNPELKRQTYIKLLDQSGNRIKTILVTDIWIDSSGATILSVSENYGQEKYVTADYIYTQLENHPEQHSVYYLGD